MHSKLEKDLKKKYRGLVAGIDEAGRGPWAGPVVAACVILPEKFRLPGLNDSKKLTHTEREVLYTKIHRIAEVGVAFSHSETIDKIGIKRANFLAMQAAIAQLPLQPKFLLIDGNDNFPFTIKSQFIIKGDTKIACIAAASIVAKVERDRWMQTMSEQYPRYEFHTHKGYGTERHAQLLREHGPCVLHRKSYKPIAEIINQQLILFE